MTRLPAESLGEGFVDAVQLGFQADGCADVPGKPEADSFAFQLGVAAHLCVRGRVRDKRLAFIIVAIVNVDRDSLSFHCGRKDFGVHGYPLLSGRDLSG